jgi:hypothetical protein
MQNVHLAHRPTMFSVATLLLCSPAPRLLGVSLLKRPIAVNGNSSVPPEPACPRFPLKGRPWL